MNADHLSTLLNGVADKTVSIDEAISRLRRLPFEQLPFATIDHHRAIRCGHPEVIFCPGKTPENLVEIARRLAAAGDCVLATRASVAQIEAMRMAFATESGLEINEAGRSILLNAPPVIEAGAAADAPGVPAVVLISAGTADLPVAEESAMTFRSMRVPVRRLNDVGVSGLHRLLAQLAVLQNACAVVVIAGMEGALPSVVGGLVSCPVLAVPTSVGYGASLGGIAALLGMLNSCASNISVVNIDNGFGAAFSASLIYRQIATARGAR